jgi:ABC-type Fe3+/spermidine/putrescine transport system ATPase subunit
MIQIEGLSIELGEFNLQGIDLRIDPGEYLVLLGPTGAGKTVLIECLVGIHRKHRGRILVDGRDVTALYPEERHVGYVPQDYALFPNMTVSENLAFGLRARRLEASRVRERTDELLRTLALEPLRERMPRTLSGGEKQRVALGRALAIQPRILLLDEPLSALDDHARWELAGELQHIHRLVEGTFLHVCHDFEEAAELADRLAIMNQGRLVQVGTVHQILESPTDEFVARFTRCRNLFFGRAEPDADGSRVHLEDGAVLHSAKKLTGEVTVAIRPERVQLGTGEPPSAQENQLAARITRVRHRFTHAEVELDLGGGRRLLAHSPLAVAADIQTGTTVQAHIPPEAVILLPRPPT